jgi:hypothetical protein
MMTRVWRIAILVAGLFAAKVATATTYYVDYASGSDSNSGTSKTGPWQHAPGMQICTNVCHTTTINAGDSIILKGGVTWPNASFMWSLPGGSTGNPVYVGVDKTWYTGSSWSRPILSPGGAVIPNNYNTVFSVPANVTVDNFEITGFYWTTASCSGAPYGSCGIFNAGQRSGQIFENLYIHGWTHAGTDASTSNGVVDVFAFGGDGTQTVHDCVVVGTDVSGDHSVNAFFNGPSTAYNNYIKQVSSAVIVSYPSSYHDNHFEDIGPAYCNMPFPTNAGKCAHENGFEDNGDIGFYFYNNVIANVSAGLALWIAPNPGYTAYMWNNVIYAIHDNQITDLGAPVYNAAYCSTGQNAQGYCNTIGTYVFYNNTIQCGDDTTQYDTKCSTSLGTTNAAGAVYVNNHYITASTANGCTAGGTCTISNNVVQTQATANGQGFTSAQIYAFSPTSAGNSTAGAGSNLTSSAAGNLAVLASDTTYACAMGTGNQPSCPARTMLGRQTSGAWDAGAYKYTGGTATLNPPRNLQATVN